MNQPTNLFVDDDQAFLEACAIRAEQAGFNVAVAKNTWTALSQLDQIRPELVCLDVNMPTGNGLALGDAMVDDERMASIPLIVVTGQDDSATRQRCQALSADYVAKGPNVWDQLLPLIKRRLGMPATELAPLEDFPDELPRTNAPIDDNSLIENIFAMLGVNANFLDDADLGCNPQSTELWQDSPPWVLCIEDDRDFSLALKLKLEMHGVAVVRAFEGMQGIQDAFTRPADAIILDYNLPNGQGDFVLKRLKSAPQTRDIPVIVLTGVKDQTLEQKMLSLGASRFLTKPLNWNLLYDELQKHVELAPLRNG